MDEKGEYCDLCLEVHRYEKAGKADDPMGPQIPRCVRDALKRWMEKDESNPPA